MPKNEITAFYPYNLDGFISCHPVYGNMRKMSVQAIVPPKMSDPLILFTLAGEEFAFPGEISKDDFRKAVTQVESGPLLVLANTEQWAAIRFTLRQVKEAAEVGGAWIRFFWVANRAYLLGDKDGNEKFVRLTFVTNNNRPGDAFVPLELLKAKLH